MEGIIYSYKSPTGKYYVGQTVNERDRYNSHRRDTIKTKTKFGRALNKYGFESFEYSVIVRISTSDSDYLHKLLDDFEIMYISIYNSYRDGYNCTTGGGGAVACSTVIRSVDRYSIKGEYIDTWDSISSAARELGVPSNRITQACSGKYIHRTSGGYLWKYTDDSSAISLKPMLKVYQYDLNMNLINEYSSIKEASESTGISSRMITKNVNNECSQTHSFIFKREYNIDNYIKPCGHFVRANKKSIIVTDKSGNFVNKFESIRAAALAYDSNEKMISSVCHGRKKSYKKLIFKFEE